MQSDMLEGHTAIVDLYLYIYININLLSYSLPTATSLPGLNI